MDFYIYSILWKILSVNLKSVTFLQKMSQGNVCLVLMVRNNRLILKDLLDSVVKFISSWFIMDLNSIDSTKDFVISYFNERKIQGTFLESEFVSFDYSKFLLLSKVKNLDSSLLILDPSYILEGNFNIQKISNECSYSLKYYNTFKPLIFSPKDIDKLLSNENINTETIDGNYHIRSRIFNPDKINGLFPYVKHFHNYLFYPNKDIFDYDVVFNQVHDSNIIDLKNICDSSVNINCFNTYGYLKNVPSDNRKISDLKNVHSYIDGLYIKINNDKNSKITVKLMGDWTDNLPKLWNKMFPKDSKINYITGKNDKADFYVVINMPPHGWVLEPEKTIVFFMEPKRVHDIFIRHLHSYGKNYMSIISNEKGFNNVEWHLKKLLKN